MVSVENHKPQSPVQLLDAARKAKKAEGFYFPGAPSVMASGETDTIQYIMELLDENEKIQRRFHELESKILSILNLQDFFEILLTEMENIFHVPCVWLTVIKKSSLADLINPLIDSKIIIEKTRFINSRDFEKVLGNISTPVLISQDLEPYTVFMPHIKKFPTGSMAVAPVAIDGEIVGSLNQWDEWPGRFEPDMDTNFIEQLMLKISLCLSNVAAHEKLRRFAFHDPLTGLLNRRALETALAREFARAQRHNQDLSLVFLDMDKFKQINDHHGHDAGDAALVYAAEIFQSLVREEDIVARYAGDEFVMVLPETGPRKAEKIMSRVQQFLLRHPLIYDGIPIPISLSCGITATSDSEIPHAAALLKKSDEKLYAEKQRKKSHYPDRNV